MTTKTKRQKLDDQTEKCILRQLGANAPLVTASLKHLPQDQRITHVLNAYGDNLQIPPCADEQALYTDLTQMMKAARNREWGPNSQSNLVDFISQYFIPELMSFANNER